MKNIFYFILTVLIISCNNNKNNNTTNESTILIDSLQKVNDLILAENQNLKQSLFDTQRNLENLKSNQVLDSKLSINEEEKEELQVKEEKEDTKLEKSYSRKEIEEIVSEIRNCYNDKSACEEYSITYRINPGKNSVAGLGETYTNISSDQSRNFIEFEYFVWAESYKSEYLYLPLVCQDCDNDFKYFGVYNDRQLAFYYKNIKEHVVTGSGEIRAYFYDNQLIKIVFSNFNEEYSQEYKNGTYYPTLDEDKFSDFEISTLEEVLPVGF